MLLNVWKLRFFEGFNLFLYFLQNRYIVVPFVLSSSSFGQDKGTFSFRLFTHRFLWIRICAFSASDLLNLVWFPPQTIDLIQFDKLPAGNVSIRTPVALLIIIIVYAVLRWFDLRLNHLRANEKTGASKACLSQRSTRKLLFPKER